jgi:trehalose-6-phosphate synthase
MWTKRALQSLLAERLHGRRLIVVSHEPPHAASRLASSLNPLMCAVGGTWVAGSSGDAPARALMPLDDPAYTVRRVPLSRDLENEYYHGLANQGLWPLCHAVFHRPVFERSQWERYRQANELFAEAVLQEAAGEPAVVFVQNYPLALLPRMLKARNPNLLVAQFWHIPWPARETFSIFPWKQELLQGLLANDLLGFQLRYDCCNFLDSVDCAVEARIDREHGEVTHAGRTTLVAPFPMGIDAQRHAAAAASPAVDREIDRWQRQLGLQTEFVGIGIDRLDCTSGIPERLRALDGFLGRHPEYHERLTFVQIGSPAWEHPSMDGPLSEQITAQVEKINANWGNRFWRPVVFLRGDFSQTRLIALHRVANFCLVGSLHAGMNLVAKEFVASRIDGDGVLILSQFSGAAAEFPDAILVNPFAEEEIEAAVHCALRLPVDERRRRMRRLREAVAANNIYRWAGKIISTLPRFEAPEAAEQAADETFVPKFAAVSTAAHAASPFASARPMRL